MNVDRSNYDCTEKLGRATFPTFLYYGLFAAFLALCPCAGLAEATNAVPNAPKIRYAQLKADDVIAVVNGRNLTKTDFERRMGFQLALLEIKNGALPADKAKQVRAKMKKSLPWLNLQRAALETTLMKTNIEVSAKVIESQKKQYARTFGAKNMTFDELSAKMTERGFGDYFRREFDIDCRVQTLFDTVYSNEFTVSTQEFDEYKQGVIKYNERAEATNAVTRALAEGLHKRILAGEDFGKIADEFTCDTPKPVGGDQGECDANDFASADDIPLWNKLRVMKVGEISPVMEIPSGYAIYKLIAKLSSEESESGAPAYHFARIFFRRAVVFDLDDDDEFIVEIQADKREKFLKKFIKDVYSKSVITFPNGKSALL